MSGLASFAFSLWEHSRQKKLESRAFFIVGFICLIIAFDQAWQDEHRNSEILIAEKTALVQERNFWKDQSYQKDATLRSRDDLLAKNYTALTAEQSAASQTQPSLAQLSGKILEINKPEKQIFSIRRTDFDAPALAQARHQSLVLVMTNLPAPANLIMDCESPFDVLDALIIEGGPKYPNSTKRISLNSWAVMIPSPEVTAKSPLLIFIGYNADHLGACKLIAR